MLSAIKKKVFSERLLQGVEKVLTFCILYGITGLLLFLFLTQQKIESENFSFVRLTVLLLFFPILFKYFLQLLIAPWYEVIGVIKLKLLKGELPPFTPKVSVLIPAWNEEVGILATIQSVLKSPYPNFEVIVINDGSTDGTHQKIKSFLRIYAHSGKEHRVRILYEKKKNEGKAIALNRGLELATGEIIVTIDADSAMDFDALPNLVKQFRDPAVMSVAGNVKIGNRTKIIGLVQQLEYLYGFYFKKADSLLKSIYIVGGAAAAYRADVFKELGVFDESIITEDIEMSTRIQEAGYKIKYAPDAIVYTEGPTTLNGLFKQRLRWKYGRLLTFYRYRHLFFSLKKRHSKFLTFFVLPIALFAEGLLFFEGLLLLIFYRYTFSSHDYLPLVFNLILLTGVISLQILTDTKSKENRNLFLLAPVAWFVFYFIDLVEYQALVRSFWKLWKKQSVTWQRWERRGVFGKETLPAPQG